MNWDIPGKVQWLHDNQPFLMSLVRVLIAVVPVLLLVPGLIWWERRLLSWMQDRIGPNRVGPAGLLQTIADGVKLFFKEDITPNAVDKLIYFIAPAVALFPAFTLAGTLPWGPTEGFYGLLTPVWNADIGLLYVLAISSLGVYGVVLSGYASNNKYSLLGGLRASAQLISYELAMGVSLACVVMAAGSLRLSDIVAQQAQPFYGMVPALQNWFILTPFGFISALIFGICVIAETNRAPFDLPEAENELIAGYHTEYSSMKFAVFFMGEYAAMFVFACIFAVVFLGGHNLPVNIEGLNSFAYWAAPITFLTKAVLGFSFFIWLRATLPRLRYDQLMTLGWKMLLPLAVGNFILTAIWTMVTAQWGTQSGWLVWIGGLFLFVMLLLGIRATVQRKDVNLEKRSVDLVSGVEPVKEARKVELV